MTDMDGNLSIDNSAIASSESEDLNKNSPKKELTNKQKEEEIEEEKEKKFILFYNILPRLPAKSLLRFKCVSKEWHSFLTTPTFEKLHLHHTTNDHHQNHHKLLALSKKTPYVFHTIDCEATEDYRLPAGRPLPFEVTLENMSMKILTSLDGLVCVGITKFSEGFNEYHELILWNPLTGDYKKLSKPNSYKECYNRIGKAFGLYYSSSDDDYKLLRVTYDLNAYIYSLKSDTWRKVDNNDSVKDLKRKVYRKHQIWWPSTYLNEKLYFLTQTKDASVHLSYHSIIRFDVKTEKFTVISTPFFGNVEITCLSHQGCIHAYAIDIAHKVNSREWSVELWRMDGDGVGKWKKVHGMVSHIQCMENIYPLHIMRDGNCLMHSRSEGLVYEIEFGSHNIKTVSCSVLAHGMDIPPTGKYIETLVSPNRSRLLADHEERVKQNGFDFLGLQSGIVGWMFLGTILAGYFRINSARV